MNLNEFYTAVLESVRILTDEHGFLQVVKGDEKVYLTKRKGLKVALPSKENLDNIYIADSTGKFKQQYLIFHPLSEDSSNNGIGLDLLIEHTKAEMELGLIGLGTLLLVTYMNPKLQSDLPYEVNEFIVNAKDKTIVGMKVNGKAVDDTMLATWQKLTLAYFKSVEKSLLTLVVPRTKKNINKDTNTREARLGSDLLFDLLQHEGTEEKVVLNGVSVRPKEVKIFTDILKFFLLEPNEKGNYVVGTKDLNAPGFIAIMTLYTNIAANINRSALSLEQADPTIAKDIRIPLQIDSLGIEQAYHTYKKEIIAIPSEEEINLGASMANGKSGVTQNTNNLHPAVANAVAQPATFQPDKPADGMQAMLMGRERQIEQAMLQQNQFARSPLGSNTIILPQNVNNTMASQPVQQGGMVSVLNPSYNSYATNQMLQSQTTSAFGGGSNFNTGFGNNMNTRTFGYNVMGGSSFGSSSGMFGRRW